MTPKTEYTSDPPATSSILQSLSFAPFLGGLLGRWCQVIRYYYDAGLQGTEWRQSRSQHEL